MTTACTLNPRAHLVGARVQNDLFFLGGHMQEFIRTYPSKLVKDMKQASMCACVHAAEKSNQKNLENSGSET